MTTQLESTKAINNLKAKAIKNGGYDKFRNQILESCAKHNQLFGTDYTPNQWK
ncbi:MAG: hypothetical protein V4497_09410 [Bacteroidota bacterium]